MTTTFDTRDVCCAALELSKTSWVCAFSAPGDSKAAVHKIWSGDVNRLIDILNSSKEKTQRCLGRQLLRWFLACSDFDRAWYSYGCF
jgi:transposase